MALLLLVISVVSSSTADLSVVVVVVVVVIEYDICPCRGDGRSVMILDVAGENAWVSRDDVPPIVVKQMMMMILRESVEFCTIIG